MNTVDSNGEGRTEQMCEIWPKEPFSLFGKKKKDIKKFCTKAPIYCTRSSCASTFVRNDIIHFDLDIRSISQVTKTLAQNFRRDYVLKVLWSFLRFNINSTATRKRPFVILSWDNDFAHHSKNMRPKHLKTNL